MSTEQWGAGSKTNEKAFDTTLLGDEKVELFFGEFPHSRQDNNIYARTANGTIHDFSGHRQCFKIEVEEYNYLKSSSLSGNEIRKACAGKLFLNGVQIFETNHRDYARCYKRIQQFIDDMEELWSIFPNNTQKEIGRVIGYNGQLFKIKSFIISQAAMMLETLDGKPRNPFLWEEHDDYLDDLLTLKVGITSPGITWFPKKENHPVTEHWK